MEDSNQQVLETAKRAFSRFREGLASGRWDPFTQMLTEDVEVCFPLGEFAGRNRGRDRAKAFFAHVANTFPQGLTVELERICQGGQTVMFELRDRGELRGAPYENRVVIAFDVRGDRIASYREYFGTDGTWS